MTIGTGSTIIAGRYRLDQPIGQGGSGMVWCAQDLRLKRQVAMKELLPPPGINADELRRLRDSVLREARAAARLHHSGAVSVYDVVEEEDRQFIVMELVEAPNLSEVVTRTGPLPAPRVAAIGLDMLDVLEAAHQAGIVHRDVKPANVLVAPDRIRLSDFGIASLVDDPSITATGALKGTPSYMAPEQAMGHATSPATDLWALGATLYFAVEGQAPFDRGQALPTLTAIAVEDPLPAQHAGPLADLLRQLLVKDPAARPDYPELRRRLLEIAHPAAPPVTAAPPTLVQSVIDGAGGTAEFAMPDPAAGVFGVAAARARSMAPEPPPRTTPRVTTSARLPAAPGLSPPGARERRPDRPSPRAAARRPAVATIRWRRTAAALVVLSLVAVGGYLTLGRSGGTPSAASNQTPGAGASATVPAGWTTYTDPATGYRVAHPAGWTISRRGSITDFRDPRIGTYLRVDHQSPPAPTADGPWYTLEKSFAAANPGYQRIRISRISFHGLSAAIWEYTYAFGAGRLHAVDIGMIAGNNGLAFNFVTTDAAWAQQQSLLNSLEDAFQAPS